MQDEILQKLITPFDIDRIKYQCEWADKDCAMENPEIVFQLYLGLALIKELFDIVVEIFEAEDNVSREDWLDALKKRLVNHLGEFVTELHSTVTVKSTTTILKQDNNH